MGEPSAKYRESRVMTILVQQQLRRLDGEASQNRTEVDARLWLSDKLGRAQESIEGKSVSEDRDAMSAQDSSQLVPGLLYAESVSPSVTGNLIAIVGVIAALGAFGPPVGAMAWTFYLIALAALLLALVTAFSQRHSTKAKLAALYVYEARSKKASPNG